MRDRPIIFSAPMVRALLDGRKTQTRRVTKVTWAEGANPEFTGWRPERIGPNLWHLVGGMGVGATIRAPYAPGDRLYVREHWRTARAYDDLAPSEMGGEEPVRYEADSSWQTWGWGAALRSHGRFRQGMHMPRWASRLTLTVTEVRVQRLQEISEADAVAEGLFHRSSDFYSQGVWTRGGDEGWHTPEAAYRALWNRLHGPDAWDANPWVVALTFTVRHGNIDRIGGAK